MKFINPTFLIDQNGARLTDQNGRHLILQPGHLMGRLELADYPPKHQPQHDQCNGLKYDVHKTVARHKVVH